MSAMQQHKGSASPKPAKSSVPFNERIDGYVAKAVPAKWLATTAAGLAATTLLFFILMVVFAFSGPATPEAAESEEIARLEKALESEKRSRSDDSAALNTKLDKANELRKEAEKKARDLSAKAARLTRAESAEKKYKAERDEARDALAKEKVGRREAERKLSSTTGGTAKAEGELKKALTVKAAVEAKLAKLRVDYRKLEKQKGEAAKVAARARDAYNRIIEAAGQIDDLDARIRKMEQLRDAAGGDLASPYDTQLARKIETVRKEKVKKELTARKASAKEATATYTKGIASLKGVSDPGEQMAILRELKQKLAGSRYATAIDKRIATLEGKSRQQGAKAAYDAAMKRVNENPKDHRENLQAIEDAMRETEGTRYAKMLEKLAATKKKTLANDVATAAFTEFSTQVKKNPKSYDENVAAGEAALARAEGSRYESKIKALLKNQKAARLEAFGRSAHDRALAQIKGSPKDYRANVTALEVLKTEARGSKWEAKIDKLLVKQKKLLARASGE